MSDERQLSLDFERQLRSDFDRGQQLAMLRHARVPLVKITEGRTVRRIKPRDMIAVLKVLDDHGRDCWPSIPTIAREARLSRCQVLRAIAALQSLSLLCIEKRPKRGGGFTNRYVIVWSELAVLCPGDTLKLRRDPAGHRPQQSDHRPQQSDHRPQQSDHRPHLGTGSATESPIEAPKTADGGGALDSSFQGEARRVLQRLTSAMGIPEDLGDESYTDRDRSLLAKVAVLVSDGSISTDAFEQVRESYLAERSAGTIGNRFAWLHRTLANRVPEFNRQLAATAMPLFLFLSPKGP